MKRGIKFRGKRISDGKWVYGSYTAMREDDINKCFPIEVDKKVYHRIWQWEAGDWSLGGYVNYEVTPETVGQFIGIKDKNGIEIYEGDIVSVNGVISANIAWSNQSFVLKKKSDFMEDEKLYSFRNELEVIGNIHDNKD